MIQKLLAMLMALVMALVISCGRDRAEKESDEEKGEEIVIPKLAVTLTFPSDVPDGYFDITYTLQNTPKAQGPFTDTKYNKVDASTYEIPNVSVKGTRNISVQIEDGNGIGILRGQGVITETSTALTIALEKIPVEEADPSDCTGFTAKIDTLDPDKYIVAPNTSITISADIINPEGDSIAYSWSTEKGGAVNPTDQEDTTFTTPNLTVQDVVMVILKIKPEGAGKVTCDQDRIQITVNPPTTPPPPPPGEATIELTLGSAKSFNGGPALTPSYRNVSFEAKVTSAVSPLTYSWYKTGVEEPTMGTTLSTSYTVPPEVFAKLKEEHPPENELYCTDTTLIFKLRVMPLDKYSEEKKVWICNQDFDMNGVCDAVKVNLQKFNSKNITDIVSLTYKLTLDITNAAPEVYTSKISEFTSSCTGLEKTCGGLKADVDTKPEVDTYTWTTKISEKDNILYNRSQAVSFSLKYEIENFDTCPPVAFDTGVVSKNIIPAIGNLVFDSGTFEAFDSVPLPGTVALTEEKKQDQCFTLYSPIEFRLPEIDADETDKEFRYAFAIYGYDFNDIYPRFNISPNGSPDYWWDNGSPDYWWDPEMYSGAGLKDHIPEYEFNYLSLCYGNAEDSELIIGNSLEKGTEGEEADTTDTDGDTIIDSEDNCDSISNPTQEDLDQDGQGNVCDDDLDGDAKLNASDPCPYIKNEASANDCADNQDGDKIAYFCTCDINNNCTPCTPVSEPDSNCSSTCYTILTDAIDNCPYTPNEDQIDTDADRYGDACDPDIDNDLVLNVDDAYPTIIGIDFDDFKISKLMMKPNEFLVYGDNMLRPGKEFAFISEDANDNDPKEGWSQSNFSTLIYFDVGNTDLDEYDDFVFGVKNHKRDDNIYQAGLFIDPHKDGQHWYESPQTEGNAKPYAGANAAQTLLAFSEKYKDLVYTEMRVVDIGSSQSYPKGFSESTCHIIANIDQIAMTHEFDPSESHFSYGTRTEIKKDNGTFKIDACVQNGDARDDKLIPAPGAGCMSPIDHADYFSYKTANILLVCSKFHD